MTSESMSAFTRAFGFIRTLLPEGAATGRLEPEHGATSAANVAAARAKIESENCLPADSDDYKNAEHHEYCVMGAGPGGLQAAEFLRAAGRDYVVFEKAASAGALAAFSGANVA